jgi:hypothetical protein
MTDLPAYMAAARERTAQDRLRHDGDAHATELLDTLRRTA